MAGTYVALMRGINVGGKNQLPMTDLREMFAEAGCTDVRTYIQSGNVIFRANPDTVDRLPGLIAAAIADRFGYRTPLVMRTGEEIGDVIRHNPFIAQGATEDALHVGFFRDAPSRRTLDDLDPDRSPPDAFVVRGREIYLHLPNGAGRTRLTNDYFEKRLDTTITGRNWRTVKKIHDLLTQ